MKLIFLCNRVIEYGFLALFFFVPLIFSQQTSELFELNKMWIVWAGTAVIVAAWISKMILRKQFFFQRTPFDIPLVLLLASQTISTIFSLDPYISFWGYYSRFNGGLLSLISFILLFYAFVSNIKDIDADEKKIIGRNFPQGILAILIAIASVFLGLFLSGPATHQFQVMLYIGLVVSFVFILMSYSLPFVRKVLFVALVSGAIVVLWGLPVRLPGAFSFDPTCYFFRGQFDTACWTQAFRPEIRMFSTLGQPAWLAAYVSVLLPFSLASTLLFWLKKKSAILSLHTLYTVLLGSLTVGLYIVLLYTNTRAGFIALWAGLACLWLVLLAQRFFPNKQFFLIVAATIGIFFIANFIIGTPISQLSKFSYAQLRSSFEKKQDVNTQKQKSSSQKDMTSGGTDSGVIRLLVWRGAIDAWKTNPIFGTGLETFAFAYYKYRPIEHNHTSEWDYLYNKAHNEYLNYLTTSGVVGFASYALLIIVFFKENMMYLWQRLRRSFRHDISKSDAFMNTATFASYVTILITNFFGFTVVIIHLFFFLLPAFFLVFTKRIQDFPIIQIPEKNTMAAFISGKQKVFIGLLLVLLTYVLFVLGRFWYADTLYAKGSNFHAVGEYKSAEAYLIDAASIRFSEPTYKDELAMNSAALAIEYALEKDATKAAEAAQQALALSNDVLSTHKNNIVFWKNRVRLLNTLGQIDPTFFAHAKDAVEHVTTLAPTDARVFFTYAVLLERTGDTKKAIELFKKTIQMKPDYRDAYYYLANAYHDLAVDKNGKVTDPKLQQEAERTMQYILKNISPDDPEVLKTLKSWGVTT